MITASPLLRYIAEKGLDVEQLSQLTGITPERINSFKYRTGMVNKDELDTLCRVLKCQPCDIVEFRKDVRGGHWEWVDD